MPATGAASSARDVPTSRSFAYWSLADCFLVADDVAGPAAGVAAAVLVAASAAVAVEASAATWGVAAAGNEAAARTSATGSALVPAAASYL